MSSPASTVYVDQKLHAGDVADSAAPPSAAGFQRQPQPVITLDAAAALQVIAGHRGPMLVDFDETLFLRNSTECFLDCARPSVLALILLRLLDLLKPWRLSGGEATRDNWRVGVVAALMPWTWMLWRRRTAMLATAHTNQPLLQALRQHGGESMIVSVGFDRIIAPLARAMGADNLRLIGTRIYRPADRRRGKLAQCVDTLGEAAVEQALGLSDSAQDTPLLERCRSGLLVQWPEARFETALRHAYLPGQYISRVKHPGQRYILRAILQEDFALWLLASLALAWSPLWHCIGLGLLLVSFWAIYEQGYADNDRCGMLYEEEPKLSVEFYAEQTPPHLVEPWIWAAGCGVLGLFALRHPFDPTVTDYLAWGGMLLGTHVLFRVYNRIDKASRVWLYSGLQFTRGAAFVVVAAVPPVGAAALAAHVFARWAPYYFYRQGGKRWLSDSFHLMRLVLFFWFAVILGLAYGASSVVSLTGAALLAWDVYRARRELAAVWRSAHRIDRPRADRSRADRPGDAP